LLERHFQNAYVTADLERAIGGLQDRFGVGEVRRIPPMSGLAVWTPEGAGEIVLKVAFAQVGKLQYELIEPVSGAVGIYRDGLVAADVMRLHHVAMRVADLAVVRAESERQGWRTVLAGRSGAVSFIYVDAREAFGHYLEYVQVDGPRVPRPG
jgi:hypothetical protein